MACVSQYQGTYPKKSWTEGSKKVLLAYGKGWSTISHISYICSGYRGGLMVEFMEGVVD